MEKKWVNEILYLGQSGRGFKLGLSLSLGHFWVRSRGCRLLYMGRMLAGVDFENILSSADIEADLIEVPGYVEFSGPATYFFVVRSVNGAGVGEKTAGAIKKFAIDSFSDIAAGEPNGIFEIYSSQVLGDRISLGWFYNPLCQCSAASMFKIYSGTLSEGVDYSSAIGEVVYSGRKFYEYLTGSLEAGRYLFDIRAVDSDGVESSCTGRVEFEVVNCEVEGVEILNTEVV